MRMAKVPTGRLFLLARTENVLSRLVRASDVARFRYHWMEIWRLVVRGQ